MTRPCRIVGALLVGWLACRATANARAQAAAQTAVTGAAAGIAAQASPPGSRKLSFDFSNPALTPAGFHLDFDATGLGHYHSQPGEGSAPDAQGAQPEAFDQQIEVSPTLRQQMLAIIQDHHFLRGECESRQHRVAFTGTKVLTYTGPEAHAGCTFNWSQDPVIMKVAENCIAISMTLEEGRRLRLAYLHDRLGLDAELETLAEAVKRGDALELENISPELRAIAADQAVMKRAQARAAALLAMEPGQPAAVR